MGFLFPHVQGGRAFAPPVVSQDDGGDEDSFHRRRGGAKSGRKLFVDFVPGFRREREIDFVVVNAENAAGGKGLTPSVAQELFAAGADCLTGGNHTWRNRDIFQIIDKDERVLRPANYPPVEEVRGRGWGVYTSETNGVSVGVVNLLGRVFMGPMECPFRLGRAIVDEIRSETRVILVDFHAEATSEKISLGWHLDGWVSAVIGTHTHVQTADETILPEGTAYQTDAGMTGPHDGVLGVRRDLVLKTMITQMPVRHELARGDLRLCGTLMDVDERTGLARGVERVCHRVME